MRNAIPRDALGASMPSKLRRIINPRRGDPKTILVNDMKLIAKYLGKGLFAKAYQVDDRVYLFANDPMKDAMAEIRRYEGQGDNPHIPLIERVGYDDKTDANIYLMPLYDKLTAQHKQAWKDSKILQDVLDNSRAEVLRTTPIGRRLDYQKVGYTLIENLKSEARLSAGIVDALTEMFDWAMNYVSGGEVGIEFNKANLSVDKQGNLVLRDVLFDAELLERYRKTKQESFMRRRR